MRDGKRRIYRDQRSVSVGATSTQLLGPNPKRIGMIVSAPRDLGGQGGVWSRSIGNRNLAVAGDLLTYTVPAGYTATLDGFMQYFRAGGVGTLLNWTPAGGAQTYILYVTSGFYSNGFRLALGPGDNVTVNYGADGASTVDATISGTLTALGSRLTVSLNGPAVLDSGITLYSGGAPLLLTGEHIGQAITEAVYAIASAAITVGVIDLSEDCDCPSMVMSSQTR